MKMNKLNTILISLIISIIFIIGITCQNNFVQTGSNPEQTATTVNSGIKGNLRIYIDNNFETRTIITDTSSILFDQYSIELTSDDGFPDRSADFTTNIAVFNGIETGSWNIFVKAKVAGSVVAMGGLSGKTITADTTTDLSVDIKLNQSATGNVKIRISFPNVSGITSLSAQLDGYTADALSIENSSDASYQTALFEKNAVPSGMKDLVLIFKNAAGTILGMYREAVNIFDNLTSDKWIDGLELKSVLLYSATDFASTNANLSNLKVSSGSIVFSSSNYFYNLSFPNSVSTFSVKPTEGIVGQSIIAKFNGGAASVVKTDTSSDTYALNVGDNTIDIEVTAQDYFTKKNYIININRAYIPATPVLLDGIFDITSDAIYNVDKNLALISANSTQIRYTMTSATGAMPANPSDPTISSTPYFGTINLSAIEGETTTYKIKAVGFNGFDESSDIGGTWTVVIDKKPPSVPTIGTVVSGGKYSIDQKFSLTSIGSDKIYYAIISRIGSEPADPSDPTSGTGILYSSPVDLTADVGQIKYYKIKAIAYDKVGNFSAVGGVWSVVIDKKPPTVSVYSPGVGSTGINPLTSLVLTFDETVDVGTGKIYIKKYLSDVTVDTIHVSSVVISGKQIMIYPTLPLIDLTQYYVIIDATAIKDVLGNAYAGISSRDAWKFSTGDTTAPTISSITSSDGYYYATDVVTIDINFSEIVTVLLGTPTLSLNSGGTATFNSGNGTTTLTFQYIILSGDNTADLDVSAINLGTATIKDSSLNNANLTLPGSPNRLMDLKDIVIDTTIPSAPTIIGITDGSYNVNQTFDITGEAGATIEYSLDNGSTWTADATATLSTDGTYYIVARQTDMAGNVSSNTAVITVTIDKTAPKIANITTDSPSGTYIKDQTIDIKVSFNEAVSVTGGTPTLSLDSGGTAIYTGGSGTATLTFIYTVGADQISLDLNVTTINLAGATIKDIATNLADITTFPAGANLSDNTNLNVDGTTPRNINVNINLITPTDFAVTFEPSGSGITINKTTGDTLFVNAAIADGGGTKWKWYLDGVVKQEGTVSSYSISSLAGECFLGIHNLAVVVTKDGKNYSGQFNFTVVSK